MLAMFERSDAMPGVTGGVGSHEDGFYTVVGHHLFKR